MKGKIIDDVPVLGDLNDIYSLRNKIKIVCAGVGDPSLKKRFVTKTIHAGFEIADPIVHPSVFISKRNTLGVGSIICEDTIITTNVLIGNFVILNRSSNVTIGEGAYLGIGSSIREKINIGAWSVIGGGAFVKNDVPAKTLYAGVPAQFKKDLD